MKKLSMLLLLLLLVACQGTPSAGSDSGPSSEAPTTAEVTNDTSALQSTTPLAADAVGRPVQLIAPTLNLTIPIEEMGWQVTQVEGERKAVWEVPENSAGWHLNSARPGTAGNMVLSGHHLLGAAVFAPVARGELSPDTQLLINDDQGHTYLYRVSKVGTPIPALGASAAEQQQADAYLAPSPQATLTLVTGWPDFSDTHYLFLVANFIGMEK